MEAVSPTRRTFLRGAAALGAGVALGAPGLVLPRRAVAQSANVPASSSVLARAIPKTGEVIPAVGLGSFLTFDVLPGQPREHIREVMRRFWEGGGRAVDTSPLYGSGEISIGDYATSLGIGAEMFIANKVWSTGEYLFDQSHARRSLEQSMNRLWRQRLDVVKCHSLVNVELVIPMLQAWKREGRVRYIGISHFQNAYHDIVADWLQRADIDFVQINYSIFNRDAESRVLRVAAERGIGVFTNMPFEKSRLFKVVEGRPLPGFAKEIGAENWAQYFLKWVISHPAVTCALAATSKPEHAAQNVGALRGPLPDRAMRDRMVKHMETIPGFAGIAKMPWYPDKRYPGLIGRAQSELQARS